MFAPEKTSERKSLERLFRLPVSRAGRVIAVILNDMKALVTELFDVQAMNNYRVTMKVAYINPAIPEITEVADLDVYLDTPVNVTDKASLISAVQTKILGYASAQSYSLTAADIIGLPIFTGPMGLANAPQAAIADAPADAVTNYNVVTTLLGSLTSAVNTANSKQNDIATKLNSLFAELRTLGLIQT